jgi:hypothetical protein
MKGREPDRILNIMDQLAEKNNDAFISSEWFLLAVIMSDSKLGKILKNHGLNETIVKKMVDAYRGDELVTNQSQEESRNALAKYTIDLNPLLAYPDSFISFKIFGQDDSDNSLEWLMEPAFAVGNAIAKIKSKKNKAAFLPSNFTLSQNYPNPFNPRTTIAFTIPKASEISLSIYDISGKFVKSLINEPMAAGYHSVIWDGTDDNGSSVASGVYFYKLKSKGYEETKRMILLK